MGSDPDMDSDWIDQRTGVVLGPDMYPDWIGQIIQVGLGRYMDLESCFCRLFVTFFRYGF